MPAKTTCDHVTGEFKCRPGYIGLTCDHPCKEGTFGEDCQNQCRCENGGECSHIDGVCHCLPGWQGDYCETPCSNSTWGNNCQDKCKCVNNARCRKSDGLCICEPGFMGQKCEEVCPEGFYGANCLEICSCSRKLNFICHPAHGCVCKSGFKGSNCDVSLIGELTSEEGEFKSDCLFNYTNIKLYGKESGNENIATTSQSLETDEAFSGFTTENFIATTLNAFNQISENVTSTSSVIKTTTEEIFSFAPLHSTTANFRESEINITTKPELDSQKINSSTIIFTSTENPDKIDSTSISTNMFNTSTVASLTSTEKVFIPTLEIFTFLPLETSTQVSLENISKTTEFHFVTSQSNENTTYVNSEFLSTDKPENKSTTPSTSTEIANHQLTATYESLTSVSTHTFVPLASSTSSSRAVTTDESNIAEETSVGDETSLNVPTSKPDEIVTTIDDDLNLTTTKSLGSNEVDETDLDENSSATTEKSTHEIEQIDDPDSENVNKLVTEKPDIEDSTSMLSDDDLYSKAIDDSLFLPSTESSLITNDSSSDINESEVSDMTTERSDKFTTSNDDLLESSSDRNELTFANISRKPKFRNFFYYYFITAIKANETRVREINKTIEAGKEHFLGLPGDQSCVEHQNLLLQFVLFDFGTFQ